MSRPECRDCISRQGSHGSPPKRRSSREATVEKKLSRLRPLPRVTAPNLKSEHEPLVSRSHSCRSLGSSKSIRTSYISLVHCKRRDVNSLSHEAGFSFDFSQIADPPNVF